MKNIFFAKFESNQRSCEVYGLWQYDYGQVLRIQDLRLPTAVEIHFSLTEKGGTSITRVGTTKDGVTDVVIPDSLLENDDASQDYWIYAYIYLTDETSGSTEYKIAMKVKSRPRPEAIDRPEDQELFREAIAAVNEAADRAENAVNNLNADVSEKVTRPETAEVGQALVVKEIDEEGKPTVFEAEDIKVPTKTSELENDSGYLTEHQDISGKLDAVKLPEAIDTALAEAKESGAFDGKDGAPGEKGEKGDKGEPGETTYIENPYDDTELKSEIATKITAPENPEVGKVFRIKTVNEDGTFIGEWADGGVANLDVQINGESIVKDGVAEIPKADVDVRNLGLIRVNAGNGFSASKDGTLRIIECTEDSLKNRYARIVSGNVIDYAVKAAMCDGKGAAWTAEEQAAARERMGIDEWKLIADITLEEETDFVDVDFKRKVSSVHIICSSPKDDMQYALQCSANKNNGYVFGIPNAFSASANITEVYADFLYEFNILRNYSKYGNNDWYTQTNSVSESLSFKNALQNISGITNVRIGKNSGGKYYNIPIGTRLIVEVKYA